MAMNVNDIVACDIVHPGMGGFDAVAEAERAAATWNRAVSVAAIAGASGHSHEARAMMGVNSDRAEQAAARQRERWSAPISKPVDNLAAMTWTVVPPTPPVVAPVPKAMPQPLSDVPERERDRVWKITVSLSVE